MVNTNYRGDKPTTPEAQQAAYDRLDPRLREVYDSAPVEYDAEAYYRSQLNLGVEAAIDLQVKHIQSRFPNWSPLKRRKQR